MVVVLVVVVVMACEEDKDWLSSEEDFMGFLLNDNGLECDMYIINGPPYIQPSTITPSRIFFVSKFIILKILSSQKKKSSLNIIYSFCNTKRVLFYFV